MTHFRCAAALASLCALAAAGCGAEPRENPFSPESAVLDKGLALLRCGDGPGAEKALATLIAEYPLFVEAHREYQNLLEAKYRKRELLEKYEALLGSQPRSPVLHYLRGRLAGEQDDQLRYFRRAVDLAPDSFWPRYGLGFVMYKMRDFGAAVRNVERAARIDPSSPLPHLLLGDIAFEQRDLRKARSHWSDAALLDPGNPAPALRSANSFFVEGERGTAFEILVSLLRGNRQTRSACALLREFIEKTDGVGMIQRAYEAASAALESGPSDQVHSLAGYCAHRLGHLVKAKDHYSRVIAGGGNPMLVLNDMRLLLVKLGEYQAAYDLWKKKLPAGVVFSPANKVAGALSDLARACAEASARPQDQAAIAALGSALSRAGWLDEAQAVLAKASTLGPDQGPLASLKGLEAHMAFVKRVEALLSRGYGSVYKDDDPPDLEEVLAGIGGIALECLGKDLGKGNAEASFSFIGTYIDPSKPESSPLAAHFRQYNQYFILGQRNGRAPEATLMTILYINPEENVPWLEGGLRMEVVLGEDFTIKSFGEHSGAHLLGAALYHGFYLNIDSLAEKEFENWDEFLRFAKNPGDLANYSSFPPGAGEDLASVDDARGLSTLLLLRAYAEMMTDQEFKELEGFRATEIPDKMKLLFEGAYAHEAMHVADARKYLPVGSRPLSALGLAVGSGFSAESIEAALEETAAWAALAVGKSPGAELASIVSFMPYPAEQMPHSKGFYDLVKTFLRSVMERKAEFSARKGGLDYGLNLFRQLHLLSGAEIRSVAAAVAAERKLLDPSRAEPKGGR